MTGNGMHDRSPTHGGAPDAGPTATTAVLATLREHGIVVFPPVSLARVGIGQSNITSIVTDAAGASWVLRQPPPGSAGDRSHDLDREAAILRALAGTEVPVPRVIGTGRDQSGLPYVVMERVPGAALETCEQAADLTAGQRFSLGTSVAETLATLHSTDPDRLGLPPPRSPYLARQLRRVAGAWERVRTLSRHDADWQSVRDTLADRAPHCSRPVIMHGDYRLSNLLVHRGAISAVLDWELCTVGDPLADLAWLLDDWRSANEPAIVMPSPTRAGGFPSRDEMIAVYQERSGIRVDDLDYYRAFTQWRAASLLEGVRARRLSGAMGSHAAIDPEELEDSVGTLLRSAAIHLRQSRPLRPPGG